MKSETLHIASSFFAIFRKASFVRKSNLMKILYPAAYRYVYHRPSLTRWPRIPSLQVHRQPNKSLHGIIRAQSCWYCTISVYRNNGTRNIKRRCFYSFFNETHEDENLIIRHRGASRVAICS